MVSIGISAAELLFTALAMLGKFSFPRYRLAMTPICAQKICASRGIRKVKTMANRPISGMAAAMITEQTREKGSATIRCAYTLLLSTWEAVTGLLLSIQMLLLSTDMDGPEI